MPVPCSPNTKLSVNPIGVTFSLWWNSRICLQWIKIYKKHPEQNIWIHECIGHEHEHALNPFISTSPRTQTRTQLYLFYYVFSLKISSSLCERLSLEFSNVRAIVTIFLLFINWNLHINSQFFQLFLVSVISLHSYSNSNRNDWLIKLNAITHVTHVHCSTAALSKTLNSAPCCVRLHALKLWTHLH